MTERQVGSIAKSQRHGRPLIERGWEHAFLYWSRSISLTLRLGLGFQGLEVLRLDLTLGVGAGIASVTVGDPGGLVQRSFNALLHKDIELHSDTLSVFQNPTMSEDGLHLCPSQHSSVLAQGCQA